MSELDTSRLRDLGDLKASAPAHAPYLHPCRQRPPLGLARNRLPLHALPSGLEEQTPLARYQQDLPRVRTLGVLAARLDELFYHRLTRKVRKDGTVSYQGERFEVPYELTGRSVCLVVDPHSGQVLGVEDENGQSLGAATPLDAVANVHRQRRKPQPPEAPSPSHTGQDNEVELAYRQYHDLTSEDS